MSINSRIQLKSDTEANWLLYGDDIVPYLGEAIIYLVDNSHTAPRMKIGDGTHNVNELPFTSATTTLHTLTFGNGAYTYDGSADVTVPVYTGEFV